ncbi:MAG: RNA polymerase sigma factor (sigma-70 family) [Thalassolituus oleivorans]|jgi:RNA polymerase sigma factor (sigma-70 family)
MSSRHPAAAFLPLTNASARSFVDEYTEYVVSVLSRMGLMAHQIDDASQETLIRALKALPKFKGGSTLKTWVHRIAYNEGIRLINKQQRHFTQSADLLSDLTAPIDAPSEDASIVRSMLSKLSPDQNLALTYFYFDELSIIEISQLMNVSNNTVKSWLKRGRDTLRANNPSLTSHE